MKLHETELIPACNRMEPGLVESDGCHEAIKES